MVMILVGSGTVLFQTNGEGFCRCGLAVGEIVIQVENLGKMYRIGAPQAQYKTLRDALMGAVKRPISSASNSPAFNSAITMKFFGPFGSVSFEVKRGDVVGIIGRNGAGKDDSSQNTFPDYRTDGGQGQDPRGRVGSLLEVGTGFHPELTGTREYLSEWGDLGDEAETRLSESLTRLSPLQRLKSFWIHR